MYDQLQQQQKNTRAFGLDLAECLISRGNALRGLFQLSASIRDYDDAIKQCGQIRQNSLANAETLPWVRAYLNRCAAHAMQGEFALAFVDLERVRACISQHLRNMLCRLNGPAEDFPGF